MVIGRRIGLAAATALLWLAAPWASADPRWWWSDLRVTDTPTASVSPHLVAPSYASGSPLGTVFVTWAEEDATDGDTEIWANATFDGGCTFCEAQRLTDNAVNDSTPRIAVLALPEGTYSIQVIHDSGGDVVVAWDATTVEFRVPWDTLCAQWRDLGDAIRAGGKYAVLEAAGAGSEPDIAAIGTQAFGHFHAVWTQRSSLGEIRYAHDLTARGGPGWFRDPIKTLTPAGAPLATKAVLAADLLTDPDPLTGLNTGDRTAVSVVYAEQFNRIMSLRSVDSGAAFSPDGHRADADAEAISPDPPALGVGWPAIDAVGSLFSTMSPSWVAVTWEAFGPVGGPRLSSTFRRMVEPVVPSPDWLAPAVPVTDPRFPGERDASIALQPLFTNDEVPAWVALDDGSSPDLRFAAGLLGVGPAYPDWSRFPIAPVRPKDPMASASRLLTHCELDEATFDCLPTRAIGNALDPELTADFLAVYAVWTDSRDANAEIYFKRTDTFISSVSPSATASCSRDGLAQVDVTFDQLPSCPTPFSSERMLRYLVYHGPTAGGPYANAADPLVVAHDPALGPTRSARIVGLPPGATWHVVVVPEDQARNVSPPAFDPTVAGAPNPLEIEIVLPDPCVAVPPCLYRFDLTSLNPLLPTHAGTYLVPRTPDDIALQGAPYRCPFSSGELEPDVNALANGVPLSLYQVDRLTETLRLEKSGATILFTF